MGTVQERVFIFMILSHSFLLRIMKISDQVVAKIKTHILCSIPFSENCAIYEIMWKNIVESDGPQMTIEYGACALHVG